MKSGNNYKNSRNLYSYLMFFGRYFIFIGNFLICDGFPQGMKFNKSQLLIMSTVFSSVLGFPNIHKVFTEEVINLAMQAPSPTWVLIVSILKLLLVVASVNWLIQLIKNIELTYRTKPAAVFKDYIIDLVLTGIFSFIGVLLLKLRLHI